jgi:hypothetical protein
MTPTNLAPGMDADRMQDGAEAAADAAGAEGTGPADPIGGEATRAAEKPSPGIGAVATPPQLALTP